MCCCLGIDLWGVGHDYLCTHAAGRAVLQKRRKNCFVSGCDGCAVFTPLAMCAGTLGPELSRNPLA